MDGSKNNGLVVGEGVRIVGEVDAPGALELHGTIEGSIRGDDITVGPTGVIEGSLEGQHVNLQGKVSERVVAHTLALRATAVVNGSVEYQSMEIEAGAQINGTLTSHNGKPDSRTHRTDGGVADSGNRVNRITGKDGSDGNGERADHGEAPEQ